jgi:protein subunit release factor A
VAKQRLFSVSIHDCRVEAIASTGGAGGQNKNRRHTAIRITHPPSGAVGFSADERDQHRNKVEAFKRLANSKMFQVWVKRTATELITGKSIEQRVDEEMAPENIKVEVRGEDGRWTETGS